MIDFGDRMIFCKVTKFCWESYEAVLSKQKYSPNHFSVSFNWFGLLGEIQGRSEKCVGVHVTIWTDAMLKDSYFVLQLLFSLAKYKRQATHTAVSKEPWIFPTTGVLNISPYSFFLRNCSASCYKFLQHHPTFFLSYFSTVELYRHITILAVIVNINSTKVQNASLPFTIKAIIVIAPTCNLN